MPLKYIIISPGELDQYLRASWCAMIENDSTFASPYFHPDFTLAVARARADVRIAIAEDQGRAVAFFPHQRCRLGLGKPVGGALSDYHGVIAPKSCEWNLPDLMRAARISVFPFDHLVGGAHQFEGTITSRASSPRMDLSAGYEAYARARREAGSEYIKKTEGLARKMEREIGALRFEAACASLTVLDQLIAWKRSQYQEARTTDVFGVPWTGRLLHDLSRLEQPDFRGVVSGLWVGERLVAAHMGLRTRDTLHYWFPAYDPEFAKFSPGIILLLRMAETFSRDGLRTIDLGKGDAQYKERLMSGSVELAEGCVEFPSVLATARHCQRRAEQSASSGGAGVALRLPLRIIRKIQYARKFN